MAIHNWSKLKNRWRDFHDRFIHALVNTMIDDGLLPPKFDVVPTTRIYVDRYFEPDVVIKEQAERSGDESTHVDQSIVPIQGAEPNLRFLATRPTGAAENRLILFDELGEPVAVLELISPRNRTHRSQYTMQYEEYIAHGLTFVMVDLIHFVGRNVHDVLVEGWRDAQPIPENPEKPLFIAIYTPQTEDTVLTEVIQFGFRDELPNIVIEVEGELMCFPLRKAYQTTARRMRLPVA